MWQIIFGSISMFFTWLTTVFSGVNYYTSAFEKSGKMVDNYVSDAVELQRLAHHKRMTALKTQSDELGIDID